jgi:transposase InsO family protein
VAIDDRTRLAYVEALADQPGETTAGFTARALAWLAGLGIQVERVLTDNGWCYRSQPFQQVLAQAGAAHRRTRPYRPQTNGKAERFHRNPVEPVDPRLHRGTSTQPLPFPAHILYVP